MLIPSEGELFKKIVGPAFSQVGVFREVSA